MASKKKKQKDENALKAARRAIEEFEGLLRRTKAAWRLDDVEETRKQPHANSSGKGRPVPAPQRKAYYVKLSESLGKCRTLTKLLTARCPLRDQLEKRVKFFEQKYIELGENVDKLNLTDEDIVRLFTLPSNDGAGGALTCAPPTPAR